MGWTVPGAGVQVGLEPGFQRLPRPVDERLGRLEGGAQHFGDLVVAQLPLPAEREGGSLLLRKIGERFVDPGDQFRVLGRDVRRFLASIRVLSSAGAFRLVPRRAGLQWLSRVARAATFA